MIALAIVLAQPAAALPMPAFLTGCWAESKEQKWTEECWTIPRGGQMMGSGRNGVGDQLKNWEWMRVERDAAGQPVFYGSPKGAAPVPFAVVRATDSEIEWRNASHDYPQRIVYRRTADGLEAEVSLADGSKANRWSYRLLGAAPPKK